MDFISHCIKRNPNKLEGRATAGMLIIFLVLSLLGWIYLTQASHVATTSRRNQELEAEKTRLQQENMELMVEIAAYESVSRLAARADELGFVAVTPEDAEFLAVAAPSPSLSLSGQGGYETSDGLVYARVDAGYARVDAGHARTPDRWADGGGGAGSTAGSGSSWAPSALLGGVKSQFTAWVREETQ
jgi:cell division protein FtsL